MGTNMSMTNESFNFLSSSNEFLHTVLNNINSCVLLLDKDLKLRAFNNALKTIFTNKEDEDLIYMRCGEAIGCAYQIEEQKDCGKTSKCFDCDIRISALKSYTDNKVIRKEHIQRPFFNNKNDKVKKDLQFSTRLFKSGFEKYIIMLVEDITELVQAKKSVSEK